MPKYKKNVKTLRHSLHEFETLALTKKNGKTYRMMRKPENGIIVFLREDKKKCISIKSDHINDFLLDSIIPQLEALYAGD